MVPQDNFNSSLKPEWTGCIWNLLVPKVLLLCIVKQGCVSKTF